MTGWAWWWGFVIFGAGLVAGFAACFIIFYGRRDDTRAQ